MKTQRTVGQKKAMEEKIPLLGSQIKKPSFYGEGWETTWEKDRQKINHDNKALRLQKETESVIQSNRRDIDKLNEARQAALEDPTQTPHSAAASVYEFSKEITDRIFKRSNDMETKLREYENSISNEIKSEIEQKARSNRHTGHIQGYMLNKLDNKSDRMSFMRQAIRSGDDATVTAVLESPSYLSGLDDDDIKHLRQSYIKKKYEPQTTVREYVFNLAEHVGRGYQAWIENVKVLETPEIKNAINLREKAKSARLF